MYEIAMNEQQFATMVDALVGELDFKVAQWSTNRLGDEPPDTELNRRIYWLLSLLLRVCDEGIYSP